MNKAQDKLADEIYQVLIGYKCAFTQIENDGGAMPLVDLLSPGKTIEEGREECSELAAEIAEAVSRHFAGLAEEWRDIETAPKDGTMILLTDGDIVALGCWDKRGGFPWRFVTDDFDDFEEDWWVEDAPTHWRPLPPPPKEADND